MIHVEQASQADADILAKLNQHVHRIHIENAPRFFKEPTLAEASTAFKELLTQENTRAFIAYADDAPIGYVLVFVVERAANIFNPARRWLYIDQISVEPERKHRGVGVQLMEAVFEYAHAAKINELETDTFAFNEEAKMFFKSIGFQPKMERFWMQIENE